MRSRPSPWASPAAAGADVERGQATVEFAIILPVIAVLMVALVRVAGLVALEIGVVDAARAGARAASVDPRTAVARAAALDATPGTTRNVEVVIEAGKPRLVTVRVSSRVRALPFLGWATVNLEATSTMAIEDDP